MKIHVEIKIVYGVERVYPACELARGFAALTGGATLTDRALRIIKDMGVEIVDVTPRREF